LGQDATFSTGYINFRFRNNLNHHVLIHTHVTAHSVTVKLFGTREKGVVYDIRSDIVKTLDPPIKYVYNPSLAKGAQKVLKNGRPGYVVDTFRTRKQD